MSSKHPIEAIEEVEETAFAMREELKEAEAAVESAIGDRRGGPGWRRCYQRTGP
jgi:hypothetical protein